jgi:hypothetical protein
MPGESPEPLNITIRKECWPVCIISCTSAIIAMFFIGRAQISEIKRELTEIKVELRIIAEKPMQPIQQQQAIHNHAANGESITQSLAREILLKNGDL